MYVNAPNRTGSTNTRTRNVHSTADSDTSSCWDQMSWAQGISHGKRYSPSWDPTLNGGKGDFKAGSVWKDNPLPMVLKTILKVVLKLCPKSAELSAALLQDDGADMGRTTTMHKFDEGVFDIDIEQPEESTPTGREAGTVKPEDLKPGPEQNRGHGKENLEKVTPKAETKAPKPETKPAEKKSEGPPTGTKSTPDDPLAITNPEAPFTDAQRLHLENLRTQNGIEPSVWLNWAKTTFDIRMASKLTQKNFERAKAWTENSGKEATDGE